MPNVFDTPDVPKPTDPNQVANSQAALNLKSATGQQNLNQIDQTNPYGSVKYTQTGTNPDGTPKYSANTSLSPQQQALLDQLIVLPADEAVTFDSKDLEVQNLGKINNALRKMFKEEILNVKVLLEFFPPLLEQGLAQQPDTSFLGGPNSTLGGGPLGKK